MSDQPPDEPQPPMTAQRLIALLSELPPDKLVAVGNDGGIEQPICERLHVRLDADGVPEHICTPDTPGAVEIFLL